MSKSPLLSGVERVFDALLFVVVAQGLHAAREADGVTDEPAGGGVAGRDLQPQFGHNKANRTPISARSIERRCADHATRHCGDGVGGSERRKAGQNDVEVMARSQHWIASTNPHPTHMGT